VDWIDVAALSQESVDINMKIRHHETCKVSGLFEELLVPQLDFHPLKL
jgi:hypothetical protein